MKINSEKYECNTLFIKIATYIRVLQYFVKANKNNSIIFKTILKIWDRLTQYSVRSEYVYNLPIKREHARLEFNISTKKISNSRKAVTFPRQQKPLKYIYLSYSNSYLYTEKVENERQLI